MKIWSVAHEARTFDSLKEDLHEAKIESEMAMERHVIGDT